MSIIQPTWFIVQKTRFETPGSWRIKEMIIFSMSVDRNLRTRVPQKFYCFVQVINFIV